MDVALIRALSSAAFLLSWKDDSRPLPEQDELSFCLGEGDCEGPYLVLPGVPLRGDNLEDVLGAFAKNPRVQETRRAGSIIPAWTDSPPDNLSRISQENALREFTNRARILLSEITEGVELSESMLRIIVRIRRTVIRVNDARGNTQEKKGFTVLLELRGPAPLSISTTGERVDEIAEEAFRTFRRELISRQEKG